MPETANTSNSKDSILIARNTPVALVVGGAGFIGSHLTEELLKKNLQVMAVDNLSTGLKEYLQEATKNKNFHFVNDDAGHFSLELPRLDYLFVTAGDGWDLNNILELAQAHQAKIVFVSSIELYNEAVPGELEWFKTGERKIAQFASEHNLNARVVRLSVVYGPRMHFRAEDGVVELIKATLLGQLQDQSLSNQFSTRAIFVDDAVSLIIKSMFAGATALKIFDGALNAPIQLAEIKQVLLDPVWYENRGFKPTDLPPWATPNLAKTMKTLNWQPQSGVVEALKTTLTYFQETEVPIYKITQTKPAPKINLWVDEQPNKTASDLKLTAENKKNFTWGRGLMWVAVWAIIFYALLYPFMSVGIGAFNFKNRLVAASAALERGDFETSVSLVEAAQESLRSANFLITSLQVARQNGWFSEQLSLADDLVRSASLVAAGTKEAARGTKSLYQVLPQMLGQTGGGDNLNQAKLQLSSADKHFNQAQAILNSDSVSGQLPEILRARVANLQDRLSYGQKLTSKTSLVANLIPSLTALETKKSYLLILQDQLEIRPAGGLMVGLVKLNFEQGTLKTFSVLTPADLDKQLKNPIEPPKELKNDLGLTSWNLTSANWEGDFPASARQIEWFFNQATGQKVDGVISFNLLTMKDLLGVIGPVKLAGLTSEVSSDNLLNQALNSHQNDFYSSLLTAVFNKLLTPQDLNWPGVLAVINSHLDSQNMSLYLDEAHSLALLMEQGWAGVLPPPTKVAGVTLDFLAVKEANLGGNKANFFVRENRLLETTINSEGVIAQKLTINYKNDSQEESYPGGSLKNNLRFYLPFGSQVQGLSWGEEDVLKRAGNFSDYGRTGLSVTVILKPQEAKSLSLVYVLPQKLEFVKSEVKYQLSVIKQSGVNSPLKWQLNYPANFQLVGGSNSGGQQEMTLEMTRDQILTATFTK